MGLKIDGCATVEAIDSSGELLIIENHDISDLIEGRGVLNWEHSNKHEDIIGAVIYALKILKRTDCKNERQRKYWDFVQKPFVYIIGELFEDEEHPGAVAVAAMVRYYANKGEKMLISFSIEGATLERRDYILQESVGRRVACTLRPCNKLAIADLYEDPKTKDIAKSMEAMSEVGMMEIDNVIFDDAFLPNDPVLDLHNAIEDLNKTLTAGMGNVAPSQLTGGAALVREHITGQRKNRLKAAVRDWDRKRPLIEVVKAALPEIADEYITHFTNLAEDLSLKKGEPKLVRVDAAHAHPTADDEQKELVNGLYHDTNALYRPAHHMGGTNTGTKLLRLRNDAGQDVLLKYRHNVPNAVTFNQQGIGKQFEAAHHHFQVMKDVFGLRDHVPAVTHFSHPEINDGHTVSAQEFIAGSKTPLESDKLNDKAYKKHEKDGHLHKIVLANHILGVGDRHDGNMLIHPKGHFMSIDHDTAFKHHGSVMEPDAIYDEAGNAPLHPEANKWLKGIDAKKLAGKMLEQGHAPSIVKSAVAGLKYYQKLADRPMTIGQMFDHVNSHMAAVKNEAEQPKVVPNENPSNKIK